MSVVMKFMLIVSIESTGIVSVASCPKSMVNCNLLEPAGGVTDDKGGPRYTLPSRFVPGGIWYNP